MADQEKAQLVQELDKAPKVFVIMGEPISNLNELMLLYTFYRPSNPRNHLDGMIKAFAHDLTIKSSKMKPRRNPGFTLDPYPVYDNVDKQEEKSAAVKPSFSLQELLKADVELLKKESMIHNFHNWKSPCAGQSMIWYAIHNADKQFVERVLPVCCLRSEELEEMIEIATGNMKIYESKDPGGLKATASKF